MKKRIVLISILLMFVVILSVSAKKKTLLEQYPERADKTYIGMSLEEFKQVWPDAKFNGTGLDNTEIWTFSKGGLVGVKMLFFTFKDNKLLRFDEH